MLVIFADVMLQEGNHSLRALEPADAEPMMHWENRSEEWWLGATMGPWSRAAMQAMARGEQDVWATGQIRLILTHNAQPLGAFDLYDVNARNRTAGVGVLIDAEHRSAGHASAGLQLLHRYAHDHLGLLVLRADVPANNPPSMRLFAAAGYQQTGHLPGWIRQGNARHDIAIFVHRNPAVA